MRTNITSFRGTSNYASPHAHNLEDLSPRDDIYSLLHVFLDLLIGRLPWTDAVKSKDKALVKELKNSFYHDTTKGFEWLKQYFQNSSSEIYSAKELQRYENQFNNIVQMKCLQIILHLKVCVYVCVRCVCVYVCMCVC